MSYSVGKSMSYSKAGPHIINFVFQKAQDRLFHVRFLINISEVNEMND